MPDVLFHKPSPAKFCLAAARLALLILLVLTMSACGAAVAPPVKAAQNPKQAPRSREGGYSYVVRGQRYQVLATADGFKEEGLAAWYGGRFHGRKTASGEKYDQNRFTAAHKTLPFGSLVEVKNPANNKVTVVRINDRGPFGAGHIIDLSRAAARAIGLYTTIPVSIRAVSE